MANATRKIGELFVDPKLIELRNINIFFVSRYRQNMRSGSIFPPMIVEAKTNRIISGNHRYYAYLAEYGEEHEVPVIIKKFKNEKEVLEEFVKENSTHGWAMDGKTKKKIFHALIEVGASNDEIAKLFNIPVKGIEKLGDIDALVIGENGRAEHKPIKRGLNVPSGEMTERQYIEHDKKDLGRSPLALAEQIIRWLKNGWIEKNESNLAVLNELQREIMLWSGESMNPKPINESSSARQPNRNN